MAIDFPSSPSIGQTYTYNGVTYTYTSQGMWAGVTPQAPPAIVYGFTTGDAKLTFKIVADPGWILLTQDGTIGSLSSNATLRANDDTYDLYILIWNNIPTQPVLDSGGTIVARGVSAAADWVANRRLQIPISVGRSIAIAGSGGGLTTRVMGTTAGAETESPTAAKMLYHGHGLTMGYRSGAVTVNGGYPEQCDGVSLAYGGAGVEIVGSSNPMNILDPTTYMNVMIKL